MIIAEIGLNHLGSEEYLNEYLDILLKSSVDAITLQVREPEFYKNTDFSEFTLPQGVYTKVSKAVKLSGKKFGVALSDLSLVPFFDNIVDFYKILSKDLGNINFIKNLINVTNVPIFISTGLSSNQNIHSFIDKIDSNKIENINLIHTRLSNEIEDVNLKAIDSMKKEFNLPVAFGNHCQNRLVTYVSIAFEPSAIFIYVKGETSPYHPDDKHAISLVDIAKHSKELKNLMKCLGAGIKKETKNIIEGQK